MSKMPEIPANVIDSDALTAMVNQKEKQLNKAEATIRIKQKTNQHADVSKQETEIAKLKQEIVDINLKIATFHRQRYFKNKLLEELIKPMLRSRISSLENLLAPAIPANTSWHKWHPGACYAEADKKIGQGPPFSPDIA